MLNFLKIFFAQKFKVLICEKFFCCKKKIRANNPNNSLIESGKIFFNSLEKDINILEGLEKENSEEATNLVINIRSLYERRKAILEKKNK